MPELSTHILPAIQSLTEAFLKTLRAMAAVNGTVPEDAQPEGLYGVLQRRRAQREQRASYDFWMLYDMAYEHLERLYTYPYIEGGYLDDDGRIYMEFTDGGKLYRLPVLIVNGQIEFGEAQQIVIDRVPISNNGVARIAHLRQMANGKLRGVAIANTAVLNRIGVIDSTEMFDNMERRFAEFLATNPAEDELPYIDIRHFNSRFGTDAFTMGRIHDLWRYQHQLHIAFEIDTALPLGAVAAERVADGGWGISIEFHVLNMRTEVIGYVPIRIYTDGELAAASALEEEDAASYFTFIESQEIHRMAKNDEQLLQTLTAWLGNEADAQSFLEAAQLPERQIEREGLITRDGNDGTSDDADTEAQAASPDADAPGADDSETSEEPDEAADDSEAAADAPDDTAPVIELDEAAIGAIASQVMAQLNTELEPLRTRMDEIAEQIGQTRSAAETQQDAIAEMGEILAEMDSDIADLQRDEQERLSEILADQSREQRRQQSRQQRIRATFRPTQDREATDSDDLPEAPEPDDDTPRGGYGGAGPLRSKSGSRSADNADGEATPAGFGGAGKKT